MTTNDLLKTGEAARVLGVSRQHVVDLCDRGELPSIRVGKHRRIRRSDLDWLSQQPKLTYEQQRQLWMHRAMLTHLLTRPEETMALARANIGRWIELHRADGRTVGALREWERVLDKGLDVTVETMLSTSPRSVELRQNSPFAGVLSEDERTQALHSFRRSHKPAVA